jgi:hypothetical protein
MRSLLSRLERSRLNHRRADLRWLGVTALAVTIGALLPVLFNHRFYYWNDSESWFLPNWYVIGERLRDGQFPLLNNEGWLGGNYLAEMQMGMVNPVLLGVAVVVSLIPDLAVAAVVVKVGALVLLGAGVYLLAREYGARPGAAAAVAVVLPLSGYTLWWDGTSWAISLFGFAGLPHVWWTLRRFARGHLHPVFPLVAGILTITCGSPYGATGTVVVLVGVAVERAAQADWRSVLRVAVVGLSVGLSAALAFLPLLGMRPVGTRVSEVNNFMGLMPDLSSLVNLSSPAYIAPLRGWPTAMTTPVTYLAWFVLPLLPWLRWSVLREVRSRAAIVVWSVVYLLFALGPSQVWLFRWPARFIEYVYLPVCLVFALLLSAGLRRDRPVARALASIGLIWFGDYLAWVGNPVLGRRQVVAAVLVTGLVGLVVLAARWRERLVIPLLLVGTLGFLGAQARWYPGQFTLHPVGFPHNVAQMRAEYADLAEGNTLAVALLNAEDWPDYLMSSPAQAAGIASLNAYTGMGFKAYSDELCMGYLGQVCPQVYDKLFTPDPVTGASLAQLLGLRNVVIEHGYLRYGDPNDPKVAPAGWEIAKRTPYSVTLRSTTPSPYPAGRVSWAAAGVRIADDTALGETTERIRYTGGGPVVLAALAWPGWTATVDGVDVPVTAGRAGLIQLTLPDRGHESTVELRFVPAGLRPGIVLYGLALLIGGGYCVFHTVQRRRRLRPEPDPTNG